nr:ATP-grasp domain-containing protein [uncultured Desulfuromonas sp.]
MSFCAKHKTASLKLMFLGASAFSIPAIQCAAQLGHHVITVDYLPLNPGHRFSHQFVHCDVTDFQSVLDRAIELGIHGIVTFSEVAVVTAALVAAEFGLAGANPAAVKKMINKAEFRSVQEKAGLNHPMFQVVPREGDLPSLVKNLHEPVICKPADSSSSRGVSLVKDLNEKNLCNAVAFARQFSKSGMICLEHYLQGTEVGGDGFMQNGALVFAQITTKHKKNFVPTGHSLPAGLSKACQDLVTQEITETCRALGYLDGPLNFDVMIMTDRVVILEMSPRLGGNGIPLLIKRATGVDMVRETIRFSLGHQTEFCRSTHGEKSCGSLVFGCQQAGELSSIASEQQLVADVPEVFSYQSLAQVGDHVEPFIHTGTSLGYVAFDCPQSCRYPEMVKRVRRSLGIRVNSQ